MTCSLPTPRHSARAAASALIAFGAVLLLAGCLSVPPRQSAPDLPHSAPLDAAPDGGGGSASDWPRREWWRSFGDDALDALVTQALAQSPDLAAAGARYEAARAAVATARADRAPRVALNADATRQRLSDNGLFPPQLLGFNWYNQFDAGFSASYTFDWWGRHRALLAAALSAQRAAEAEHEAAALALATSVCAEYFGWQSETDRHELAVQELDAAQEQARIVAVRTAADVQSSDDAQRAQLTVLSAKDHLGDVETTAQIHQIALAALVGRTPSELPALVVRPLPILSAQLPANASLDLIARRADISASRWRVEGAARSLDVARTQFLPDISLSALAGVSSREIGRLLEAGSAVPSLGVALHLPWFDGGMLRANYAHSQADLAAAIAAYRASIVAAAREVNTQLANRDSWLKQAGLRVDQVGAAAALRVSAAERAAQGVSDRRPELAATQQWLMLRETQLQTNYALLSAQLALIQALGGGYQMDSHL